MSKKKPPKKFRKQREREETLLRELADAITACEKAKMKPKLHYDMAFTSVGYVLPPLKKGGKWDARPALSSPHEDIIESLDLYALWFLTVMKLFDSNISMTGFCLP
jgi:hypothetical protein